MVATLRAHFHHGYCVPFYELLYVSELSAAASPTAIAEILVQARTQNKLNGINGLLLFDGEHFVQALEGSRENVMALMHRIERDERHFGITRLHEGLVKSRHFQNFAVGYWYVEDEPRVMQLRQLRGQAAMDELRSRRNEFDVEG